MARARSCIAALAAICLTGGCLASPGPSTPTVSSEASAPVLASSPPLPTERPRPSAAATPAPILTSDALREVVALPAVVEHLEALQAIAERHGGNRATGTEGFARTVAYVAEALAVAGYAVEEMPFDAAGVPSTNVLAERAGTDATEDVVMVGAHLDSVVAGAGINDNGSGVAVLLAVAQALVELPPPSRTVRIAFWGAEENGPFGSEAYVAALPAAERARIAAYLNFDILGSPNAIRFVYAEASAAPGSEALTAVFAGHFASLDLPWEPIDLEGDSDHGPFSRAGVPTGGLFSGGIEPVTTAQAATFGAIAGQPADPCSHSACDTMANTSAATLDEMADAVAHAVAELAGAGR